MRDKFGIEIQMGDVLAMISTYKDYPPVICVADNGFTPQYTKCTYLYLWGYNITITPGKMKTKNLVILNEEQIEGITNRIIQTRIEYQDEMVMNERFIQLTEEEIRGRVEELLVLSREIKENN